MPTIQQEIILNALPGRVWEFVTALRYLPQWLDGIASVQAISDRQASVGTTFTALRRGRRDDESWLVADLEAPHRLRLLEYRRNRELIFQLEPVREGTRFFLQYTWPAERGLLGRFLPPRTQQQMVAGSLTKLQELIKLNQDIKLTRGMGDE